MTITEIRTMLDLIKKFTDENPLKIEKEIEFSEGEMKKVKQIQNELEKQDFQDVFKRFAFYKPDNQ